MAGTGSLFIVDLTYIASLDRVDALIRSHLDYLERGYSDGVFLVSGRKEPRTGGVVIAHETSRDALQARVWTDPFIKAGVAEVTITEVVPGMAIAGDLRSRFGLSSK